MTTFKQTISPFNKDIFTHYDEQAGKWLLIHNRDVPDTDFETGKILWGMSSDVIQECDNEEEVLNCLENYGRYQNQFN